MKALVSFSKKYLLQDLPVILTQSQFIGVLCIDTHIKCSFSFDKPGQLITGWYIETYSNNHVVDDKFLVYCIHNIVSTPFSKPLYISVTPTSLISTQTIVGFLKTIPFLTILLLNLLLYVLPTGISSVLQYINLVGFLALWIYFWVRIARYIIQQSRRNQLNYKWMRIVFEEGWDVLALTEDALKKLKALQEHGVISVTIIGQNVYLKQPVSRKIDNLIELQDLLKTQSTPLIQALLSEQFYLQR